MRAKYYLLYTLLYIVTLTANGQGIDKKTSLDAEKLGRALDYFTSEKYHESLLLFTQLNETYELNPHFHAYMGVCYYHEMDYDKACQFLDEAIPQLESLSPDEKNVYLHINAESHFEIKEYERAADEYRKQLQYCHDNEKCDVYYKLGFCHVFHEQWKEAYENFQLSFDFYQRFPSSAQLTKQRSEQLKRMIDGCKDKLSRSTDKNEPQDEYSQEIDID